MLFLKFSLRRTFIQRSRYRLSTIPEITAMDRLLRLKPMVTDDYDDNFHEDIDENDSDINDGDPDPFHRLGRHLLKLGKISYRKIDFLPDWIEERQREVYYHRTQSQIRRCIKNWMLRPNKDLMPIYLQRPLGWKKIPENDRIREIYAYGPEETIAYTFFFFPARFSINSRIMREIKSLLPEFCPTKVIDFGCGPGTSGLAAKEVWGELLKKYVGVDLSKSMLDAAKILLQTRGNSIGNKSNNGTGIRNNYRGGYKNKNDDQFDNEVDYSNMGIADCSFWEKSADVIQRAGETGERYNLAIVSYVLTDLNSDAARLAATQLVFELLEEGGLMVIIDVGNPMGSHAVRTARQYLLDTFNNIESNPNVEKSFVLPPPAPYTSYAELGASVVAPCTHDKPCPLSLGHWCSFSQKVKSGVIRKGSEEKFSYVIIRKTSKKIPVTAAKDAKKYYSSPAQVAKEWTKEKTGKTVSIIPSSNAQNMLPHRWTASSPAVDYNSLSTDDIISKHARPTPLLHMLIREEERGEEEEEGNELFGQESEEGNEEIEEEDEEAQWLALEKDLEQKIDEEEREGKGLFGMSSNHSNNVSEGYDYDNDNDDGLEEDDIEGLEEDEDVFLGSKQRSKVVEKLIDHVDWEDYNPDLYRSEWSRILRSPLKANRHVTLDLCAPTGQLVRTTYSKGSMESIPSLFSALRKSSWGGLFPALDLSHGGITRYHKKSYLATSRGRLGYNKSTGKSRNKLPSAATTSTPEVRKGKGKGVNTGRDLSRIDSFDTFRADSNVLTSSKKLWTKKAVAPDNTVNKPVSNHQTSVVRKVSQEPEIETATAKGKGGGRRKASFMDTSKLMEAHRKRRSSADGSSSNSSNE